MFSRITFTVLFFALSLASPINEDELRTTAMPDCPQGFFPAYSTFQCFQIFNDTKLFMDAEIYCNSLGGHLASIHSGFDNALLTGGF